MEDIRKLIRKLMEGLEVGKDGQLSSDDDPDVLSDTTIELVSEYIQKNMLFSSSRYGKAQDYFLPLAAAEYFDHIGFKAYRKVKARNTKKGMWKDCVVVEFWYLPAETPMKEDMDIDMTFDAEEVSNFVDDYIRRHKIDERSGIGPFRDYYLPIDAKQAFDEIGFTRYKVERADNPEHADFGKTYVVVPSWVKVN